jgi:hypothetical protein
MTSIHLAGSDPRPRAVEAQQKIQMRINTANAAGCIVNLLLLMMFRTQTPTPMPVLHSQRQIWPSERLRMINTCV